MPHSMKPIIAVLGSDSISEVDFSRYISPDWCGEIVGGGETTFDSLLEDWCKYHKIEYAAYVPNYKIWGRRYARDKRDDDILSYVDKLVYFWDNIGEMRLVEKAVELGLPYRVHVVEER